VAFSVIVVDVICCLQMNGVE
jgi:hypothetical protein